MKTLLKKLLTKTKELHKYVILKKDEKGFYIEYAFCEGAPHDNRCLDWYHSYQPEARRRNGNWDDELLKIHEKHLNEDIGKLYYLSSFTCGGEENPESQIERRRKAFEEWHPGEEFIPEDNVCKVGKPCPRCLKYNCPNWTYEEPVKCACWSLNEVKDASEIRFSFTAKEFKELIEEFSE